MKVLPLFPTPVYTQQFDPRGALNIALRDVISNRRRDDAGVNMSNVRGWQSKNDMVSWGGEAAAVLARQAVDLAGRVTVRPDAPAQPTRWQPEMWANVNEDGDSNQSHWHPGSYLSAVYYVDDGYDGDPDPALGGELVLIDPRMPYLRMRTPDLRQRGPDGSADEHETWVRPRTGLLLAFPSFLPHSVRVYRGRGTRISIAINMIASPAA
ncbi:putative 2OG-Fe(II) oxygenase [Sphingomonas sanxanigenens]|uniref:Fe2OG dioxygenase domain-containing protein n=1 Tax=Sphingomonas sanxanigenens DSM 19645 = NX02 TaxID=1123269 RepID=W0AIC1_9SPHN|nr:putative 2OG-Fe(II) oxygenase [Sphingomonas sanxanigenens]AHE56871.1 hypothetical protein NX02_26385 [Sphingomonas sanxanigenens DSM 19645 = NX02]